jgi:purine-binding chemotaxis protein CheW
MVASMTASKQLVLFRVAGQMFGVEIELIKEIVPYQDVTPVPETYDFVEGIINLRGKIVTVIDMRRRLRAQVVAHEKSTRILILDIDGRFMGLIVDAASEVVRVPVESIGPPPELISEVGTNYITGIVRLGERLIVLLELRQVLSAEEVGRLDDLIRVLYAEAS